MKKLKHIFIAIIAIAALLVPLCVSAQEGDAGQSRRMETVIGFAEDAMRYARYNVPGALYPNIFVNGYSVDTKKPVEWKYKGGTYYPANITVQQNFLRVLVGLTNLTGEPKYRETAEEQVTWWFTNPDNSDKNGLLYAGEHSFVCVKTGKILSYNEHEMKQVFPYYDFMYEVEPEGVKRYMEACWNSHVIDWSNLSMNRHGYYNKAMSNMWDSEYTDPSVDFNNGRSLSFQNAGDDLINYAFFIADKTGEEGPRIWGRRMLQKYIDTVNPVTGLSGAQYGEQATGDRLYLQYGPEFGELAKEYNYINKYKIKTIAGFAPQYLLEYAQKMNDQEIMDYVVNSIEGTAKHVYNAETNKLETPMWSDGTSLQGYVTKRAGYHGVKGKTLPSSGENVHTDVLLGTLKAYFATERETLWQFARDMGKGFGLGDLGTKPGENVNLTMETEATDPQIVFSLLNLYNETGNKDYLTLAENMGENIIDAWIELKEGRANYSYVTINREDMVALLRIEATVQGIPEAVDDGIVTNASVEFDFDGVARTTDASQFWAKTRIPATKVTIDGGEIVLPINSARIPKFTDISESDAEQEIRALYALGAINGVSDTAFAPDRNITRAELISIAVKLCEFPHREKKFAIYPDVEDDAWYRDAVEAARNNGLIDESLLKNGLFAPNDYITNEEMISVVVRALTSINKDTQYNGNNAINKLSDAGEISQWAKKYVDIACNYLLITDTKLSPKENTTREKAALFLVRLNDMIARDYKDVTATVFPSDATKQYVNWSSSDTNIFEVDANGRIYPVAEGSAILTAEVDGVTDTRTVNVVSLKDYMLKNITFDGVELEGFVPTKHEYEMNLLLGTNEYPEIAAQSYSGDGVKIEIPEKFPGAVVISVGDAEEKYTLNFTAGNVDYKMNEDFEGYLPDRGIHNIWTGDVLWNLNSKAWEGKESSVLVRNIPRDGEDNKCLALPYHEGVTIQVGGKFPEKPYIVGGEADEKLVVLDFDLMVTNPLEGVDIRIGGDVWPIKLTYSENSINAATGAGVQELGEYTPGEWDNIKIVVDKKTMLVNWYLNGNLILEEQEAISVGGYDKIEELLFALMSADSEPGAMAYLDNVKLYQVPREYAEVIVKEQ